MPEEFEILTPETEGGTEFTQSELAAIQQVATNLADILLVAASINTGAPLTAVDGNVTKIQVRRKTAAAWALDAAHIPAAGEICVILDNTTGNFEDMKIGDGNVTFPLLPSVGAAYSSADLINAISTAQLAAVDATASAAAAAASASGAVAAIASGVTDAEAAATAAEAAATGVEAAVQRADDFANKAANQEVITGKYSAYHYAELAAARARNIAKIPITWLDNANGPTYTLQAVDLYRYLYYTGSNNITIELPPNLDTAPAFDGSVGLAWTKLVHWASTAVITIQGASGTPAQLSNIGRYGGNFANATDFVAAGNHVANISVPAGNNRILWISAFDINSANTSHPTTLASDVGTVTQMVAGTSLTGEDVVPSPSSVNGTAWRVVLPDSTTATAVALTFGVAANMVSLTWWGGAMANASAVACSGASGVPPAGTGSVTFSHTAGQRALLAIAHQNGSNVPGTPTGMTNDTAFRSGTRTFKDAYVSPMYSNADLAAGSTTASVAWTDTARGWAHQLAIFTPVVSGSSVALIHAGDLTLNAQGEWAEIYCHSYDNKYSVLR